MSWFKRKTEDSGKLPPSEREQLIRVYQMVIKELAEKYESELDKARAENQRLLADYIEVHNGLYGTSSFNPGASAYAVMWEMKAKELEAILESLADIVPTTSELSNCNESCMEIRIPTDVLRKIRQELSPAKIPEYGQQPIYTK